MQKLLGKITCAEFGTNEDHPYLMGLKLSFSLEGGSSGIGDGAKYTINISKSCKWQPEARREAITELTDNIHSILKDAKVNYVSELKNKPVEVTVEGGLFKGFRILTEVL